MTAKELQQAQPTDSEPDDDDRQDVIATLNGSHDAFARIVRRHQAYIGKLLWRFTRDHGVWEGLVQDAFVETFHSLGSFQSKGTFRSWLTTITTRVGYAFWKDQAKQCQRELQVECWDNFSAISSVEHLDPEKAAELVYHLLAHLPPRDRLVLTLMYLEECTVKETSRRVGWSQSMVKVQAHRARNKLRKLVKCESSKGELKHSLIQYVSGQ